MNPTSSSNGPSKKVALFGGAFDPPHLGHMNDIRLLLKSGLVDQVWVVPSGERWDKAERTPPDVRIELLQTAVNELFGSNPRVSIFLKQIKGEVPAHSMGLVDAVRGEFPGLDFIVVIGHELLNDLPKWRDAERLKAEVSFLLITRPGYPLPANAIGYSVTAVPNPDNSGVEISSTEIREHLKNGGNVTQFLPGSVYQMIRTRGYYRT